MSQENIEEFARVFNAAVRENGIAAVWPVIDTVIGENIYDLLVHLGRTPLHRKRMRSLRLADQRIQNVKTPRLRPRDRKGL